MPELFGVACYRFRARLGVGVIAIKLVKCYGKFDLKLRYCLRVLSAGPMGRPMQILRNLNQPCFFTRS